jgi:hypothetical protein
MTITRKPNGSGTPGTAIAPAKESAPEVELWTERHVMARYPWSRALLRKWRKNGQGPPFTKLGRSIFYRPAGVREWVIAHEMAQLPQNQRDSVAQA